MRAAGAAALAAALCACSAGAASAATYCVSAPGCTGTATTLQSALGSAAASSADDTVEIGPVSLTGPFSYSPGANGGELSIVGAGQDRTSLTGIGGGDTVLSLGADGAGHHARVSDVAVTVPKGGSYTYGIKGGRVVAESLSMSATGGAGSQVGMRLAGGSTVTAATILFPVGTSGDYAAIESQGDVTIDRSNLSGVFGVLLEGTPSQHLTRSTVRAGREAVEVCNATAEVDNVVMSVAGAGIGLAAQAASRCASSATSVTARQLTVIGDGSAGSTGVDLATSSHAATVDLRHSIVRGFAHSVDRHSGPQPANITVGTSDIDLATAHGTAPGGVGEQAGNLNVDPAFVDPASSDYHLRIHSPVIDAGPSEPFDGVESTTDRDANPRIVNGDGDGVPARDMGAYEYQPGAPRVSASGTPARVVTGQAVSFAASGSDPDQGDSLSYAWAFDDGATAVGPTARHAFAISGVHHATVTATDTTATSASTTVAVVVVRPRPPVTGPRCSRRFTGTPARDVLTGTQGGDRIVGLAGGDVLNGLGGDDCLDGGPGNDRLYGGKGNDRLVGGSGNDRLDGGPGRNSYDAGPGNDTISAANGVRENVVCGTGRDVVRADRSDKLEGCERVTRVGRAHR